MALLLFDDAADCWAADELVARIAVMLQAASNDKRFVIDETDRACQTMADQLDPAELTRLLLPYVKHKNPKVTAGMHCDQQLLPEDNTQHSSQGCTAITFCNISTSEQLAFARRSEAKRASCCCSVHSACRLMLWSTRARR